ncbi:hypothetical protein MMC19_004600 [Ptychographa xylographoides]|nr:hypothetical protein [Ptychographa xylographoides]
MNKLIPTTIARPTDAAATPIPALAAVDKDGAREGTAAADGADGADVPKFGYGVEDVVEVVEVVDGEEPSVKG